MTKSAECEDSEGIISVSSGSLILVQVCIAKTYLKVLGLKSSCP